MLSDSIKNYWELLNEFVSEFVSDFDRKTFSIKQQIKLMKLVRRMFSQNLSSSNIAEQLIKFGDKRQQQIGVELKPVLEKGGFSEAFLPWIDKMAYTALAAGEAAGDLLGGVDNAIHALNTKSESSVALIIHIGKPFLGFLVVIGVAGLASQFFFDVIAELSDPKGWQGLTYFAYMFGELIGSWGVLGLIILIAIATALVISLPLFVGDFRLKVDRCPLLYRQYRLIQCNVLLRTVGNLMKTGMSLNESLEIVSEKASPYLSWHVEQMLKKLDGGVVNIGDVLDTKLINEAEINAAKILGNSGGIIETLITSADIHHQELMDEVGVIKFFGATIIKTVAIFVGALIAAGILFGIIDFINNVNV
ncbi:TPA: type II secretion system F family protein [Shewanella algae]|uniref:type II secretion system F family protein n=1 Tax=Shewanella TaxID=22 RepID=UPI00142F4D74|nr:MULTISPECIES: type II secretion system F family protein [Shewanella]NJI86954.1 hypothetical protein [Shewanella sp. Iso12]HDS1208448.1 type II secretion system F family protein [Shewanella algae]